MPKRNVELLEKVMQHIEDYPETHMQMTWTTNCGTSACFAGWTCLLDGYQHIPDTNGGFFRKRTETRISADTLARERLGLTSEEGHMIFAALNSRSMLRLMVKDLVNGDSLRYIAEYRKEAEAEEDA